MKTKPILMDIKYVIIFSLFFNILALSIFVPKSQYLAYSQPGNNSSTSSNVWTSERNNLNITMTLMPQVPIIDQKIKILFDVRTLNDSSEFEGLKAKVTLTDHDSRLYKFENKIIPIYDGKFSVEYIFPDDGQHRILLQLYKNTTPFTVGSFDIFIPHSSKQPPPNANKDFFTQFFDNFFN
ncbi:hypothetical protein [Candidatus Nitrosocosmicus arcticus]|nr:hypothetical protein [Candidatus Nitrosocosmicus arcticus]